MPLSFTFPSKYFSHSPRSLELKRKLEYKRYKEGLRKVTECSLYFEVPVTIVSNPHEVHWES